MYNPDSKYIVSGSGKYSGIIKIWNIKTGKHLKTLSGDSSLYKNTVVMSSNGKYIVSGGYYNNIMVWDIKAEKYLSFSSTHTKKISSVAVSPDAKYIISGSDDETIKIWDIQTGECLRTLENYRKKIGSVIISPDGKFIVSVNRADEEEFNPETIIRIWDIQTGNCLYTIDYSYTISIDENSYFTGSDENIDKYLRVSEEPLTQRKLTPEEINHFRKKDNFLEIGEIIEKPIVEELFILKTYETNI